MEGIFLNLKKLGLLLFCFILTSVSLIACSDTQSLSPSYYYYQSEKELVNDSDLIIVGEVVKANKAEMININLDKEKAAKNLEEDNVLYTVFDIKVDEVIKGNVNAGDIIKIKQAGDKDSKENRLNENDYFKKGSTYAFFLQGYEERPDIPYSTLSTIQGQLEIENGKVKVHKDNKLFKDKSKINKDDLIKDLKKTIK